MSSSWGSNSAGSYSFVMNRGCFCFPAGEFDVVVADFKISSMTNRHSGERVDSTLFQHVHTIEQMFDLIDEARREGADKVDVHYAPEGYPKEISIDWIKEAVDDELFYGVSDVVVDSN